MPPITVEELAVPTGATATGAADFVTAVEIMATVEAEAYGHDELRLSAAEVLPQWQDPASPRQLFGVRVSGQLVGWGMLDRLLDEPDTAWLMVGVLAEHRHRGIGTALADALETLARDEGRTRLLAYAVSPEVAGERIPSPTGFGSVPADNPEVRFLLGRGYRLQQVERGSRLVLPVEVSIPDAGADYRLHYWIDRTPAQWREDMVLLLTRMSMDAPSAGLEEPEDVYTVERLLAIEESRAASPRSELIAAVEHVPSGRLAGYTLLSVPAEVSRAVHQDDTLVLREHRGHRLGMLLKVANLDHLQRERPGHPSVVTFNAEENRYMLDVNETLGFTPMGYEGAWRKDL